MTVRTVGPIQSEVSEHAIQVVARWSDRWRIEGDWFGGGPDLTVFDGLAWMLHSDIDGLTAGQVCDRPTWHVRDGVPPP